MQKPRLQSGEPLPLEHLLPSLYISNQGFFSGGILPAANVPQLLLVCSVPRNLHSYLCLASLAGKEAAVK